MDYTRENKNFNLIIKTNINDRNISQKTINKKNRSNKNIYELIFTSLLFINVFIYILSKHENISIKYESNYIILKINKTGLQNVFTHNNGSGAFPKYNFPDEIYINEEKQNDINYQYNLNKTENEIKLMWNNSINNSAFMFFACHNITEIDLSNFDASNIIFMTCMFSHCLSLTSINLTNYKTSKVKKINRMFENCSSLISVDVSSFDTSNVEWMNHMFCGCQSLISLSITNFITSNTTDMEYLFSDCSLLTSLDLSNFNTSLVRYTHHMFLNCILLKSLDLSNFDTSKLTNMNSMFSNCKSLISLNLNNFYTPKIIYIEKMFSGCSSLVSLDISNLNISNITNLESMFSGCSSLTSLDLSSFDTSTVTNMMNMFYGCSNLTSLDLSNFNTSKVERMQNMFNGCLKLEYINLKYFDENNLNKNYSYDIFKNINNNITLCINDNINIIMDEIMKIKCYNIECSNNWLDLQQQKIKEKIDCTYICLNKYQNNKDCLENCTKGYYIDNNNIIRCNCETDDICIFCSNSILTNGICTSCYNNFYSIENEPTNLGKYNCYDKIDGYYLDNFNSLFKKCYYTCETCETKGDYIDHNCLTCKNNYSKEIHNNNYLNCYNNTNYDEYLNVKFESNFTTKEINKKLYERIVNAITENFDILNEDEKIIEGKDNFYYQFTTLDNEINNLEGNNNNTNKFSKIDLGQCEDILREKYKIDKNISLLMIKYEKVSHISSERNLQFEIYDPINKTRLNLSVCNNASIDVYIPVILSEQFLGLINEIKDLGYDIFDIKSDFYQDICTPFKSPNGADVLLSDRINYYFNNEETQCQPNCHFSDYSFEKQNLKCKCDIENSEINFDNKIIISKSIYTSFYDVIKYSNYKVLKCFKLAFSLNIFKNNIGNIIVLVYFVIFFILIIIYCRKGTNEFKINIFQNLFNNKIKANKNKKIKNINADTKLKINIRPIKKLKQIDSKNNITKEYNNKKSKFQKNCNNNSKKSKKALNYPPKKKFYFKNKQNIDDDKSLNIDKSNSKNLLELKKIKNINNNFFPIYKNENLDNYELNNLDYEMAIILDKRNLFEIYWSFLRREHLIIFTFFIRDDHNITYVKYSRFIFIICTDMVLNVFFFSDETMHKMYLDYGKYNFIQQIPQIIYSSIVSQLIELFLCFLSLTDKYYYQIKNLKIKSQSQYMALNIIKCIKIKICFFFIFTGLFFLFYWYIITCFCAVYENTQKAFIKDSYISFGLNLLYPFIIYLFPTILRILSINYCKGKLSFVYKLSDIIPFF